MTLYTRVASPTQEIYRDRHARGDWREVSLAYHRDAAHNRVAAPCRYDGLPIDVDHALLILHTARDEITITAALRRLKPTELFLEPDDWQGIRYAWGRLGHTIPDALTGSIEHRLRVLGVVDDMFRAIGSALREYEKVDADASSIVECMFGKLWPRWNAHAEIAALCEPYLTIDGIESDASEAFYETKRERDSRRYQKAKPHHTKRGDGIISSEMRRRPAVYRPPWYTYARQDDARASKLIVAKVPSPDELVRIAPLVAMVRQLEAGRAPFAPIWAAPTSVSRIIRAVPRVFTRSRVDMRPTLAKVNKR